MKIKLDENLPESLLAALKDLSHQVDSVREEGLAGRDDREVWQAAQDHGRFLITQDLDFSDLRKFSPGTHHGLLLRLRFPGRQNLFRRLIEVCRTERMEEWKRCFVLVTERKIRVHSPQTVRDKTEPTL